MQNNLINRQNLYYGKVIQSDDPQKLGRVRALISPGEMNNIFRIPEDKINENGDDIQDAYKWTREDPYVYLPLLPFFNKISVKPSELVLIFFGNPEYPQQNKFYIPGVFSSPTSIAYQNFEDAKTYLSDGTNYKEERSIQDKDPSSSVKTDSYGIFPEPSDNGLLGRGSSDLILKENTALLRAGKSQIQRGVTPTAYNRRAFLELDYFPSQKETDEQIRKRIRQEKKVSLVKFLIEFQITNPDNSFDKFTGNISIFKLIPNILCNTENLNQDSKIEPYKPAPIYRIEYQALSKVDLYGLINDFIIGFNDGVINIENYPVFKIQDQFPFYFRLSPINYNELYNPITDFDIKENIMEISGGVNPFNLGQTGYTFFDLVSSKGTTGPAFDLKIEEFQNTNYENRPITYGILGGDELYFISHDSQIPGKQKIAIDKSIYGYEQDQVGITMKDNTNSMVRGEKLMEFLNLVIKFLTSHVHSFHGLPPVPVSVDGTSSADILKQINEAYFTILNENIRIN
jgi:hypothetical protein